MTSRALGFTIQITHSVICPILFPEFLEYTGLHRDIGLSYWDFNISNWKDVARHDPIPIHRKSYVLILRTKDVKGCPNLSSLMLPSRRARLPNLDEPHVANLNTIFDQDTIINNALFSSVIWYWTASCNNFLASCH